jgi:hypothetical protein
MMGSNVRAVEKESLLPFLMRIIQKRLFIVNGGRDKDYTFPVKSFQNV